jgi:hypothetical protein
MGWVGLWDACCKQQKMHVANNKVHNIKCLGYDAFPVEPTTSLGTNLISGMWYNGENGSNYKEISRLDIPTSIQKCHLSLKLGTIKIRQHT